MKVTCIMAALRSQHGFDDSPECISSNASCHSSSGQTPPTILVTSSAPVASRRITRSQIGQLWLKLPWSVMFFCTSGSSEKPQGAGPSRPC